MFKKLLGGLAVAALTIASAANGYQVTFFDPVVVNGTMLKPGDYNLEIKDNVAIIKQGKTTAQAAVKLENNDKKFTGNTVLLSGTKLHEIRLGGTHTRVVFENSGTATN